MPLVLDWIVHFKTLTKEQLDALFVHFQELDKDPMFHKYYGSDVAQFVYAIDQARQYVEGKNKEVKG